MAPPLARKSAAFFAAYALALHTLLAPAPFVSAGVTAFAPCAPSGDKSQPSHRVPDRFGCAVCPLAHGALLVLSDAATVLIAPPSVRLAPPAHTIPRVPSKNRQPVARGPPLAA